MVMGTSKDKDEQNSFKIESIRKLNPNMNILSEILSRPVALPFFSFFNHARTRLFWLV